MRGSEILWQRHLKIDGGKKTMANSKCQLPEKLLKSQLQRHENDLECATQSWASSSFKIAGSNLYY